MREGDQKGQGKARKKPETKQDEAKHSIAV